MPFTYSRRSRRSRPARSALSPAPLALLALAAIGLLAPPLAAFEKDRAAFSVHFKDEVSPYTVVGVFVMPGETVPVEVEKKDVADGKYELVAERGETTRRGLARWSWRAPKTKGRYTVKVVRKPSGKTVTLNVFVMVPAPAGETLNGYTLGAYPAKPLKNLDLYRKPKGFVEVTEANRKVQVAPHFTLGQFLCKQEGRFPKYLVLRERLPLKLEKILEAVNEEGIHADGLVVMSGYRTPLYNHVLQDTQYSRHIYGDAADVYIDQNHSGAMDDLNHDGKVDEHDAIFLGALVDRLQEAPGFKPFVGGIGLYKATPGHGPYVHVDVRGTPAHWKYWEEQEAAAAASAATPATPATPANGAAGAGAKKGGGRKAVDG